jgi:hypothetical protein
VVVVTKLWVVLGTKFNEVVVTKLEDVAKLDVAELPLSPSSPSPTSSTSRSMVDVTKFEFCSRIIGTFSFFFFSS